MTMDYSVFVDDRTDEERALAKAFEEGYMAGQRDLQDEGALHTLAKEIHSINQANGWFDTDRSFGDDIALLHTEVSEAYEEHRKGHHPGERYYSTPAGSLGVKPEGIPSELADVLIRVLDTTWRHEIDLDEVVAEKLSYNRTRGYRHGGKAA